MFFKQGFKTLLAFIALATCLSADQTNICEQCRSTVSYLKHLNSTKNRPIYRDAIKNFCQIYYPSSLDYQDGPCSMITAATFYILDHTEPDFHCDQIGACDNYKLIPFAPVDITSDNGVLCDFCVQAVDSVKKQLSDPKTLEDLADKLDSLCEYLKLIDGEKECRIQMKKFIAFLRNFANQIDSEVYCESIKLCSNNVIKTPSLDSNVAETFLLAKGFGLQLDTTIGEKIEDLEPINEKHHDKGPVCILCKMIVMELEHLIGKNKSVIEIEHGLQEVCQILARKNSVKLQQCQDVIDKYTKELVEILTEEMKPDLVCMLINQCVFVKSKQEEKDVIVRETSSVAEKSFGDLLLALDPSLKQGSFEVCVECKMFVRFLKDRLKNPTSEEEVKTMLKSELCDKLPEDSKKVCSTVIDKYANDLFLAISKNLDPKETCVNLGACKSHSLEDVEIINLMASILGQSKNLLNSPLEDSPSQVDSTIVIVGQSNSAPVEDLNNFEISSRVKTAPTPSSVCNECIKVIQFIDEYISKNDVDNNVNKIIDNVCKKLENNLSSKCTYIVEVLGSELISAITTMESPQKLCSSILLC